MHYKAIFENKYSSTFNPRYGGGGVTLTHTFAESFTVSWPLHIVMLLVQCLRSNITYEQF